jgi:hypothetical protein
LLNDSLDNDLDVEWQLVVVVGNGSCRATRHYHDAGLDNGRHLYNGGRGLREEVEKQRYEQRPKNPVSVRSLK